MKTINTENVINNEMNYVIVKFNRTFVAMTFRDAARNGWLEPTADKIEVIYFTRASHYNMEIHRLEDNGYNHYHVI